MTSSEGEIESDDNSYPRRKGPRSRHRKSSHCSLTTSGDEFPDPGEQRVEDVTITFFYKPRTITLLAFLVILMLYFAFVRDADKNHHNNFWHGAQGVFGYFVIISLLICPNGPFVRPHPAVWRIVFGCSILYSMFLVFALFQSYEDLKIILQYMDPKLKNVEPDNESYSDDCSFQVFWSRLDVFVVAHFLGWTAKALMLRHAGMLWLLSITWEFTELAFAHLLENFKECWWDSILLDVMICNALGIHFGLWICSLLEMRTYHWESFKDISGTSKKFKRAVLQFTPVSWTEVRWFDPKCWKMRYVSLCVLCIIWQIAELNTFFLKHIFVVPTSHWLNVARLFLIGFIVLPTLRQFYIYVTDIRSKSVGRQCWVFVFITFLEATLCVRHARELFSHTEFIHVAWWICFQLLFCLLFIYVIVIWRAKRLSSYEKEERETFYQRSTTTTAKLYKESKITRFKDNKEYDGDDDEENLVRKRKPMR